MAEVAVTAGDNGRVIVAKVGDAVVLRLPENPTTGYAWAVASMDSKRLETGPPVFAGGGAGLGTGGVKTWTFRARAPGKAQVELKRGRHWEGDASVVERFAVTLDIRP